MAKASPRQGKGGRGKGASAETTESAELFTLPLGEFTAARNALAARLKKAGHEDEAQQVKALQKPPITAWTVNQLYWRHREAFNRLLNAGEKFRTAQLAQLAGTATDLRGPLEARREVLTEMSKLAAETLRAAGHAATPDTTRRITTTLEALSTYADLPGAPQAGQLQDDIDAPGFETLAALVPAAGAGKGKGDSPSRVLPFRKEAPKKPPKRGSESPEEKRRREEAERRERIAAAKAAVQDAERTLREARKAGQQAEAALKKAAARAKEADQAKDAAEQDLERATAAATSARVQARETAAHAEDAAQAVEDAERALERAREELRLVITNH